MQLELPQQCVILVINVAIWPETKTKGSHRVKPRNGGIPRYDLESCPGHHSHDFWPPASCVTTSYPPVSPFTIIMVIIRSNEDRYIQWLYIYTQQLEYKMLFEFIHNRGHFWNKSMEKNSIFYAVIWTFQQYFILYNI